MRSINKFGPILLGPKAQTCSATPTHSFPASVHNPSSLPQNSSTVTSKLASTPSGLISSTESFSGIDLALPSRRSRWSFLRVGRFAMRKLVILSGSGAARMVKVTRPACTEPRIVPRGRPGVLTGAMSAKPRQNTSARRVEEKRTGTDDSSFSEGNDWRRDSDLNPREPITQILQTTLRTRRQLKLRDEMRERTSRCNSPAVRMTCSPVSCTSVSTQGSA